MNSTAFYISSIYLCSIVAFNVAWLCKLHPNKAPKWIMYATAPIALISMGIIIGFAMIQAQTTP